MITKILTLVVPVAWTVCVKGVAVAAIVDVTVFAPSGSTTLYTTYPSVVTVVVKSELPLVTVVEIVE